jgi:hypothetical protein
VTGKWESGAFIVTPGTGVVPKGCHQRVPASFFFVQQAQADRSAPA